MPEFADVFVHDSYLLISSAGVGAIIVGLGLAILIGLAMVLRRLAGSTLLGPWCWAVIAVLAISGTELWLALSQPPGSTADAWRFVAATSIFCPLMSLLGAKRPQDQAWHFIVLTLWGMLALPAAEALLLRPGQPLAIIDFRAWFLLALIGLGLLVMLPTRRWLATLLMAGGETIFFWAFLPGVQSASSPWHVVGGLMLFVLALLVTLRQLPRQTRGYDRLWLDFRDAFGSLWGARVLERVNATAVLYDWSIRLGWNGFHRADDPMAQAEIPAEITADLKQTLVNLLRRFVSQQWIDDRL